MQKGATTSMSTTPSPGADAGPPYDIERGRENWGSRLGVVLAVAGSAVGLGNFLRFPGTAVNNGGGAFMIPYMLSFLLLGIPIAWCEWTMGRLGGRFHQNSAPGIMYAIWRRGSAKGVGALALLIPVGIYMYYILLEAWCLDYCIEFAMGGFRQLFAAATADAGTATAVQQAVIAAAKEHQETTFGMGANGALLSSDRTIWLVLACFFVNFVVIYQGITRGIEVFCKYAMPLLIGCALIILVRVLTLPKIGTGLGFMWNPDWQALRNPSVWLAAAGQIFFTLSLGFGVILCYASYLRRNDDVVLTSLSASSTNEFCEVILGGLIVVPTAFIFLGAENATASTFSLGFVTMPAIMHYMPLGNFVGALWFGLLFLAAVTSSLSMLQPAIAFLEDGFGLGRRSSVALLAVVTALGAGLTAYFSRGALALDYVDFWCNLSMILVATVTVLVFGWVIGIRKGMEEMNRGADFPVPRFMAFVIKYITPSFLIIILGAWFWTNSGDYLRGMMPEWRADKAERALYVGPATEHFLAQELSEEAAAVEVEKLLGTTWSHVDATKLPDWLPPADPNEVAQLRTDARVDANVARFVFIGLLLFFLVLLVLADLACRNRIGRLIAGAEADDGSLQEFTP